MSESKQEPQLTRPASVTPLEPWALTPTETARVESCGLSTVYERIARGEYDAVIDGTRTKVLYESIRRRRATLPRLTPELRAKRAGPAVRERQAQRAGT